MNAPNLSFDAKDRSEQRQVVVSDGTRSITGLSAEAYGNYGTNEVGTNRHLIIASTSFCVWRLR